MFGTALMVVFKMISQWNVVAGRQIINALMLSISIIINVFLNLILIPRYNIYGAAIASVLGYLTCAILFLLYFSRKTKIPIKNIIWVNYNDFSLLITKLNFYRRKR